MLRHALVRPPGAGFDRGLTTAGLGAPDLGRALEQHGRYCESLARCGLTLTRLPADERFPDSTFVEDTAVLTPGGAVVTRPGAPSRRGEVADVRAALAALELPLREIVPPGTLDGGDVCEAGDRTLIGISQRTNPEGARQLAALLATGGCDSTLVDVRGLESLLHLKSGVAWIGDGRVVASGACAGLAALAGYEVVRVPDGEDYAANCVRVNDRVLVAAGHPGLADALERLGCAVLPLEMSEFRKMDGGLSCLSLRF